MEKKIELLKKLHACQSGLNYIQKKGKNQFQGYSYVRESDMMEKACQVFNDNKILFLTSVIDSKEDQFILEPKNTLEPKKQNVTFSKVVMQIMFYDIETGESIETQYAGTGSDYSTGDKAIFKSITGCLKFALLKFFLISSGDDPENDSNDKGFKQDLSQDEIQKANTVAMKTVISDNVDDSTSGKALKKYFLERGSTTQQVYEYGQKMKWDLVKMVGELEKLEDGIMKKIIGEHA